MRSTLANMAKLFLITGATSAKSKPIVLAWNQAAVRGSVQHEGRLYREKSTADPNYCATERPAGYAVAQLGGRAHLSIL